MLGTYETATFLSLGIEGVYVMSTIVRDCLREIEGLRRQFRGQPDEIRPRYRRLTEGMLVEFIELTPEQRVSFWNSVAREESGLLLGVARSAATSSVTEESPDRLRWGLLGLLAENQRQDFRETLIELTLLDNSARRLGGQLEEVFESVKPYASDEMRQLVESYFKEGDRHLTAMGYIETTDETGRFTYEQQW